MLYIPSQVSESVKSPVSIRLEVDDTDICLSTKMMIGKSYSLVDTDTAQIYGTITKVKTPPKQVEYLELCPILFYKICSTWVSDDCRSVYHEHQSISPSPMSQKGLASKEK